MYTIAMAYCGTGNNEAVRKLLHVAVCFRRLDHYQNKTLLFSYRLAMLMMMSVVQQLNHWDF